MLIHLLTTDKQIAIRLYNHSIRDPSHRHLYQTHDKLIRELAVRTNSVVVFPEYRNAHVPWVSTSEQGMLWGEPNPQRQQDQLFGWLQKRSKQSHAGP